MQQLEFVQQWGFMMLGPLLRRQARQIAERDRWGKMVYYNGLSKPRRWRYQLEMKNRFCAYAFLVDPHGLVRWKAVGMAQPDEVEALIGYTKQLLSSAKRLAGGGKK